MRYVPLTQPLARFANCCRVSSLFSGFRPPISALACLLLTALFLLPALPTSRAAVVVNIRQVGSNVVASGGGTLNLFGLNRDGIAPLEASVGPRYGALYFSQGYADTYLSMVGPRFFGDGDYQSPDIFSGDIFGVDGLTLILITPTDYVSGTNLSGNLTWNDASFESLGITSGNYVWTWGSGANADSFTLNIAFVAPPSLPATHWLGQSNSIWSGLNWASDAAGNATTATPTSTSNITFSATGANNTATVLDQDFTINSLTVNSNAGIQGNKTLTISQNTTVTSGTFTANGGVTISSNGSLNVGNGTFAVAGNGTSATFGGTVIGTDAGSNGAANISGGTWNNSGILSVGENGSGSLTLSNGTIAAGSDTYIGRNLGSNGNVTVSGGNLTLASNKLIYLGTSGSGILNLSNGTVTSTGTVIGGNTTGDGTLNITGGTFTSVILAGFQGNATVNLSNGTISSSAAGNIGLFSGSRGVVNVTGGNWTNSSGNMTVGSGGNGTLNLRSGGVVTVGANGTVILGATSGSNGTLNIGVFGGNSTAGTLNAAAVSGGNGTAVVNFNQTDNIIFTPNITGRAAVNQLGNGTTTLTGNSNYNGTTKVSAGALYVNGNNSSANGEVTITGGTLGGSGRIGGNVTVKNGGTITAGSNATSTGFLLTKNLTLESGSTALFQFSNSNYFDQVGATSLAGSGNITLSLQLTGSYTGIVGDTFQIFSANSYSLGSANFNLTSNLDSQFQWDLTGLASSGTVKIALSGPVALPATHWLGQTDNTWSGKNWASDAGGNATTATPAASSNITFSATGANNTATVLDQDFTINSLTVNSSAGIQGNKTLTISQSTTITSGTFTANGGVTISSNGSLNVGNGTFAVTGNATSATFVGAARIGTTAGSNGTVNVSGGNLTTTNTLTVGNNGTGKLNLSNGTVSNSFGILGNSVGSTGTANVTGGSWTNAAILAVGASGNGTLSLSNGTVSNTQGLVGYETGSSGTVNVTGGNWTNSQTLTVGSSGNGTVTISNGGRVNVVGDLVTLGALANSTGTLNIGTYGGNSKAGTLNVSSITGGNGTAVVNFNQNDDITFAPVITGSTGINQLGNGTTTLSTNNNYTGTTKVSAGALYLNGDNSLATGNVTVTGGTLGGSGKVGGNVTVKSGGTITAGSNAESTDYLSLAKNLSLESGSTALFQLASTEKFDKIGMANLSATGNVTLSLQLVGDYTGEVGDKFNIFYGDNFSLGGTNFSIASNLDSKFKWNLSALGTSGTVSIELATLSATHWLGQTNNTWSGQNWASDASGNATTATPTSTSNITFSATGANNTATLLDADTTIASLAVKSNAGITGNKTLTITEGNGVNVSGGTFTVSGGTTVESKDSSTTIDGASGGATLTVTGAGTAWNETAAVLNAPIFPPRGVISVGVKDGNKGILNVLQGALVKAVEFVLGENAGSTGNVGVSGNGSKLTSDFITVGNQGTGNLTIESGGEVETTELAYIAKGNGSVGNVTVTGTGTKWNATNGLVVGYDGGSATLNVLAGGNVTAAALNLGANSGATGNVTISGAGSKISTDTTSIAGGGNGTLKIEDGGELVSNLYAAIAEYNGSIGTATVTGTGSKWTIGGDLTIDSGGSGTLNILDGGVVSNANAVLAASGLLQATVTVNGTNSTWTNSGNLTVGDVGPATLDIKNGGKVSNTNGFLGNSVGSTGTANVTSGNWTNSGTLFVGFSGNGALNLSNGSVSSASAHVGFSAGSNGNATVSGGNWTNTGQLNIGTNGTGTLNLSDGKVTNTNANIASNALSTGTVNVTGGNWTNSGQLVVGANGKGTLNISNGVVSSAYGSVGSGIGSTGTVNVSGGTWTTSGCMTVGVGGEGALNLTGGNVTGSSLLILGSQKGSSGTLRIGEGTTAGNIDTATIFGGSGKGYVFFNHDNPGLAFSPVLTGRLNVSHSGPGTTILSANNSYTGSTYIQAGTLQTTSSTALGTGAVYLTGGNLAPTGTLNVESVNWDGGTIALTLGTTVNAVNLLEGNLTVDEENGGTFAFASGAGFATNTAYTILSAPNMGSLSLSLFSGNTLLGITPTFTINGKNLQVAFLQSGGGNQLHNTQNGVPTNDNFTTNGTVVSGLTPNGTIEPQTFINNLIVPNSNLLVPLTNTLTLSGFLTSTNSTITINGTLNVAGNFTDPNSTINVNGTMYVGGATSVSGNSTLTIATNAVMTSVGATTISGNSTLTISNNAVMTSLGGTTITNSNAVINGRLNSPQVTLNGGLLKGSGLIAGNLFNNGTVNPGNSPGTLTISGNYVQSAAGALALEIASTSLYDRLFVGGTASLAGNLLVSNSGGPFKYGQQYAFLQAGSINGNFNQIVMPNSSKFRGRFLVQGGTGSLLIAPTSYTLVAQNANQRRVAKALNSFIPATSGDKLAVSTALDLQSASQYPAAFQQIMPSFYQSLPQITISQAFAQTQMINQRQSSVRLGASGFQAMGFDEQPLKYDKDGKSTADAKGAKTVMVIPTRLNWSAWAMGTGIFSNNRNIQGVPNYRSQAGGFLAGADYAFGGREPGGKTFTAGVYGGYNYTYAQYASNSLTQGNSALFGLYATYAKGGFYADAVVGGGYNAFRTRRSINFSTVDRTANSTPDGGQFNASLNLGYDWNVSGFTFGPIIGAQYTYAGTAPFTETGADSLDLRLSQQNVSSLQTTLGGRVAFTWNIKPSVFLIPEVRLFWQHEFLQNPTTIGAALDGGAGSGFNYVTDAPDRDSVFAGAGLTAQLGERWNSFVFYNISFGNQQTLTNSVSAGLGWKF